MQPVDAKDSNQLDRIELEKRAKQRFKNRVIRKNAISTSNVMSDTFNINEAKKESHEALTALNVTTSLQSMLVAQMLSVHELQQRTIAFAHGSSHADIKKYYINSAVKLANCFVQQANLLAKLQGIAGQKIIVERVDVHQGGQAIVGTIQGPMSNKEKT
ncbi:hypothetical protein [Legionella feeleii]|uniref:Uncharacterized protein n=1 Tax=Legionella feeleii TaxID=453 RepID=A0A0W0U1H1_9GAMM|nr:hypothetical protein [Legionella feeleii]KTD01971.1 hypothetical protein Lfee_0907 [Legionella feeleii]SPX62218.1 Uncharacterised protein [Legionella feeleii]